MDSTPATRGELTIIVAGAVTFFATFLPFYGSIFGNVSAWDRGLFPLTVILPFYGVVMATHIALTRFGRVRLPRTVLGFTWEQLHLVLGLLCAAMAVAWIVTDVGKKGLGLWLEAIGGIALAYGAVTLQRERNTGAF